MTGISVALTFHSLCTCNLKSLYFVIFSNSFALILLSSDTTMSIMLHSFFFSLCQLSQCQVFRTLFQHLLVLQNSTVFCISCFPAPVLDDENMTSLHNLFEISCTEANGTFFLIYCGVFFICHFLSPSSSSVFPRIYLRKSFSFELSCLFFFLCSLFFSLALRVVVILHLQPLNVSRHCSQHEAISLIFPTQNSI